MAQFAVGPQVTQVWTGGGPVLLANQDITNTVTICNLPFFSQDAQNADTIPALGSIAYQGGTSLYALAPAGTAALLVVSGGTSWAPSPAQVALQIATLGLAKDSTLQTVNTSVGTVNTTLGSPAQDSSVQSVKTNTANALSSGVPPGVPNIASASQLFGTVGGSPYTLFTFGSNGRLAANILATDDAFFVGNTSAPSTPTGGGILYVTGGALHYKGSSGTDTTLASA
jgi:hypothetical protein